MKIIRCLTPPVKKTCTVIRKVLLPLLLIIVVSETHRAAAPDLNIWSSNGPNADISRVVVDPSNPSIIYAASAQPGGQPGVFKSINNGASWSSSSVGLGSLGVRGLAIDPGNPNILYAGTAGGVFKTTNGAANWSRTNSPLVGIGALAVSPSDPSIVYAATYQGIFITTDSGQTWNARSCPDDPNALSLLVADPQNPNIVYIAFDFYKDFFSKLFKSIDGGASWRRLEYENDRGLITHSLKIDSVNPNIIYAATFVGVYKSSDGGMSWNLRGSPSPNGAGALVLDPNNRGTVYASGIYENIGVYKSTDGGTTWTAFNNGLTNLNVNDLAFDRSGTHLHAATSTGVFRVRVRDESSFVSISGRVMSPDGRGLGNVSVALTDQSGLSRTATTSSFGYYTFADVRTGESYLLRVASRRYRFTPLAIINANENIVGADFVGLE